MCRHVLALVLTLVQSRGKALPPAPARRLPEQEVAAAAGGRAQLQTGALPVERSHSLVPQAQHSSGATLTCGILQVPELPVYGVAIPTVSGLRLVLDELGAEQGARLRSRGRLGQDTAGFILLEPPPSADHRHIVYLPSPLHMLVCLGGGSEGKAGRSFEGCLLAC